MNPSDATPENASPPQAEASTRKRPKPGERRLQILQALASMLEQPGGERVTTAALAQRIGVSEAALYRHFASKAQMFEALIDFIEDTLLGLIRQIADREDPGRPQLVRIVSLILQFAERNPGMCRVMTGDALVLEHARLQERMNRLFDKFEAQLRQSVRESGGASPTPTVDAQVSASVLMAFVQGRLSRYVRTGFQRLPTESLTESLQRIA